MPAFPNPRVAGPKKGWPVVEDKILPANSSSFSFENLSGDNAYIYRITGFAIGGSAVPILPALTVNNDTSAQYEELVVNLGATYSGVENLGKNDFLWGGLTLSQGQIALFTIDIYAQSGASSGHLLRSENHTVTATSGQTNLVTGVYGVSDEITSIQIFSRVPLNASEYGAGSRFQLSMMSIA